MSKEKINSMYTLDNFIVRKSNQVAFSLVQNITEYDFLIFYGKNCSGKTHLLWAIDNLFVEKNKSVVHVTSEVFLNEMIHHINNRTMNTFRKKYRDCDVLLIDDIQYFSGKPSSQEEFYHSIEARKLVGKKTILVSNKNPKHLTGFSENITNQLLGIPSINIKLPNKKTIDFLIEISAKNTMHLNGMISKLQIYSLFMALNLDFKTSKKILKDEICIRKNVTNT